MRVNMKQIKMLFLVVTASLLTVSAQQTIAPFKTNQMNSTYYPGQSGYPTIQSAVTKACAAGTGTVQLQPGITVTDTIGAVTNGCANVAIIDTRIPQQIQSIYFWNGTNYGAVTALNVSTINAFALSTVFPNSFPGLRGFTDSNGVGVGTTTDDEDVLPRRVKVHIARQIDELEIALHACFGQHRSHMGDHQQEGIDS